MSSISLSCLRQIAGMRLVQNLSPRCSVAPSFMFSSTVSSDSALVSWNVRTWPMRATLKAGMPDRVLPSNDQVPAVGLVEAAQQVEQRRLAGAVRADQRGDRAARDLEVLDVDGGEAAEAPRDVVGDHDRVDLGDAGYGLALGEPAGLRPANAAGRGPARPSRRSALSGAVAWGAVT